MAKHMDFTYNDVDYRLEFNRITCMKANVSFDDLDNIENNPMLVLKVVPSIWSTSFLMHHADTSEELKEEIYDSLSAEDESEESGFLATLIEIYCDPIYSLVEKQGNVKWKKSW